MADELIMGFMSSSKQWYCSQPCLHCRKALWISRPTACKYFSLMWWSALVNREAGIPMISAGGNMDSKKPGPRMNGMRL